MGTNERSLPRIGLWMGFEQMRQAGGEPRFLPERGFGVDLIDNRELVASVKQVVLIN